MENTGGLAIAKVAIEYHDPSNVFQHIELALLSRLPLRNLHWKSPRRPLRSIESLHAEIIPAEDSQSSRRASQSQQPKERRHQIPGLRQTPYLKIFVLRCDDSDSYKTTHRKSIREWLKNQSHVQSGSKKTSQENDHDAFEWLVLHVIVPDTAAANEPGAGTFGARSDSDKGSKFLNRASTTILEKLKADFNSSSKNTPDRIAQIRLKPEQIRSDGSNTSNESQEQREAWDDIIAKTKALILASFSVRVHQYEEDIREREIQRALPGWNFCTFFILKEGLARGFESVGLVDDALALYEGLDVELDGLLENITQNNATISLLEETPEVKRLFEQIIAPREPNTPLDIDISQFLISATKKNFRDQIMSNNVSVFDFKTYMLARKMAVYLRMSRVATEIENLVPLGQLCQIASFEIPGLARMLREELSRMASSHKDEISPLVIDNIVASWLYTVSQQILDETQSAFLSGSTPSELQFTSLFREKGSLYPTRKTSLTNIEKAGDDAQELFIKLRARYATQGNNVHRTGKDFLAMQRSSLVAMQRRVLEELAMRYNYIIGWSSTSDPTQLSEVGLDEEDEEEEEEEDCDNHYTSNNSQTSGPAKDGIFSEVLISNLNDLASIRSAYQKLTYDTLDLYFIAGQSNGFERMIADLAILRYYSRDYTGAANFFNLIIPVYSQSQWNVLERQMLIMHAKCTKLLNRRDDYVRMLLGILAKVVTERLAHNESGSKLIVERFDSSVQTIDGNSLIDELFTFSRQLPYEVSVDMNLYFQKIQVDPFIQHTDHKDGFDVTLRFQCPFQDTFTISSATIVLDSIDEIPATSLTLKISEAVTISKTNCSITLHCDTITYGLFKINSIQMLSGKINFVQSNIEQGLLSLTTQIESQSTTSKTASILVYPKSGSFNARIVASKEIAIHEQRYVEVICVNGCNDSEHIEMKLRPGSAGLRLHITKAELLSGNVDMSIDSAQNKISIKGLQQGTPPLRIKIPYDLEDPHREIGIRLDISFKDSEVKFTCIENIVIEMPIEVTVEDVFKQEFVLSKFHVKTATNFPISVYGIELNGTDDFEVETPPCLSIPSTIQTKQIASFLYKIYPIKGSKFERKQSSKETPLGLVVNYRCLDQEIQSFVINKLEHDLVTSNFKHLDLVLIQFLRTRLLDWATPQICSKYALIQEVDKPTYDQCEWDLLYPGLESQLAEDLKDWLIDWHSKSKKISALKQIRNSSNQDIERRLVISVPLPRLHVLHFVDLKLDSMSEVLSVGKPVSVTLTIEHTRKWESKSSFTSNSLGFVYDVNAPFDSWIIGGPRRGQFLAEEEENTKCSLILIPLKTGRLLLPSVEVRYAGDDKDSISCETIFKQSSKSIIVIEDIKQTTIAFTGGDTKLMSALPTVG